MLPDRSYRFYSAYIAILCGFRMTLTDLQQKLKDRIRSAARELFNVEPQQLAVEAPPRPELVDLALPGSFELAKLIKQATGEKQAPRAIAEKLKTQLEDIEEVS